MKEIQINDLEYANLEKLYNLITNNEASVTCNGFKVLAFSDPEWSNNVDKDEIDELEDFIIQNQDAPDETPVITSKTVVESHGVGEFWTSEERVEELSYFRDLLKKYKALIEKQKALYEEKGYIDTSIRKSSPMLDPDTAFDIFDGFGDVGLLKDAITFIANKPVNITLDHITLMKLDSYLRIVLKDKPKEGNVLLNLIVNFIDLDKGIANVTPVADYKGKGGEVIAIKYFCPSKPNWDEYISKPFSEVSKEALWKALSDPEIRELGLAAFIPYCQMMRRNKMKELDIEITERDNNIPPEKSILARRLQHSKLRRI